MEIRQVKYFIEIIKTQSYSMAAKNLFITQPTLSWNMTKLQEELGTKLIYQVGNTVMPTTAGSLLYDKGTQIVNDFEKLTQELGDASLHPNDELTIGSNAVISPFFMPLIEGFMSQYPKTSLTIEEDGSIKTQKKIANGELELGVVSYPIVENNLNVEKNSHHRFQYDAYVVMRADHPLAKKEHLSFKDLKEASFVSMSKDYVLWHVLQTKARENGYQPTINFLSNSHEVLIQNILKTGAIGILPIQLQSEYTTEELVWIKLKDKMKPFDIVVVHKKEAPLSPTAALFLEYIINNK